MYYLILDHEHVYRMFFCCLHSRVDQGRRLADPCLSLHSTMNIYVRCSFAAAELYKRELGEDIIYLGHMRAGYTIN